MTLAQVQVAVAIVVTLIATWAGLLMTVALLMPDKTARAERTLVEAPKQSALRGLAVLVLGVISFLMISSGPPLMKVVGNFMMLGIGFLLILGGAGLAQLLGKRIAEMSGARTSFGSLVRGCLLYSLAMGFPYFGWLMFLPLSAIFALGAGITAVWPARRVVSQTPLESAGVA